MKRLLVIPVLFWVGCGQRDGATTVELACSVIFDGPDVSVSAPNEGETTGPDILLEGSPGQETEFCNVSDGSIEVVGNNADIPAELLARKIWKHQGCASVTVFPSGEVVYPLDFEECE